MATIVLVQDLCSGTVESTPLPVPVGQPKVTAVGLMSDETARDPATALILRMMASYDGGKSYVEEGRSFFTGNPADDPFNAGHPVFLKRMNNFSANPPTHVKVALEIGQGLTVSVGVSLAFSA